VVCVDELHLFVQFGLWFRSEFSALRIILFDKLKSSDDSTTTLHLPILFMSATCNNATVEQLTLLTGFTFTADNVFWPSILGMQQRRQRISFLPSNQAMGTFSPLVKDVMACNGTQQCIVYSNSRAKLVNIHNALHDALDAEHHLHQCNVVLITGPQSKEQKFHRTKIFLLGYDNSLIDGNAFNAICGMTTRALGSAGWDSATGRFSLLTFPLTYFRLFRRRVAVVGVLERVLLLTFILSLHLLSPISTFSIELSVIQPGLIQRTSTLFLIA
jgi:hypothetical protein